MKTVCGLAVAALALLGGRAEAENRPLAVDLELVLAVDVSYSMEIDEQRSQRTGYVEAFLRPEIVEAIRSGPWGRIAVTYVEWGGTAVQVLPWTLIDGRETSAKFAEKLRQQPLRRISFTSISNALAFSRRLFQLNPYAGRRRVIDISGDGPNNAGTPAPVARNNTVAQGIVIDGLPIMLNRGSASIPDLDAYFKECVIGGQGAFLLRVSDIDQFSEAIFRKLLTEISGLTLSRLAHPSLHLADYRPVYNCFVGEEMHERRIRE